MAKVKIIMDREKCIGCGSCVAVCPVNWEIKDDGKSKPKKTELNEVGCNEKAAQVCPVQCIKIEKA
ncbi:MAG: ferredoxin [Candidatus Woesearchaeota archaeon]|nr:MAG: ferredoxin [Candidatus Woesearchaeota archaeon]